MIKSVRFLLLLIAFVSMQIVAWGQPQERLVQVQVTPDHTNWLYKPGEKVKFKVAVLKCNIPQDNLEVRYEISEDMMKPHQTGKQPLKNEKLEINAGTMKKEGFLRCRAFVTCQGREYEGVATVGFSPEKLQPTTPLPADFLEFWKSTKEVAEKLGLTQITYAEEILEVGDGKIKVKRHIDGGVETVEGPLPIVITVNGSAAPCRPRNAKLVQKYKHAKTVTEKQQGNLDYTDLYDKRDYLNLAEWSVADVNGDLAQCGLSGSPTKVKAIQNIVFQAKESKTISGSDRDVEDLIVELLANHTIG